MSDQPACKHGDCSWQFYAVALYKFISLVAISQDDDGFFYSKKSP